MQLYCGALHPPERIFCHPFICGTPFTMCMAASWEVTEWSTGGTVSGSTDGVTVAPLERVTCAGIPPSGHRPGLSSHQ